MTDAIKTFLHDHLCKEEQGALRYEAVESRADFLMEKGEELDPFDGKNFSEAISQLTDLQILTFKGYVEESKSKNFKSEWHNEMLARMISIYVHDYWRDIAMKQADKEVE